LPGSLLLFP